ncbi:MAG: hypothetical protein F6K54_34630 [Okeania sp. SIO3B5]|uniref:hypothetical protein n=1 Tax=Okeania sp. SIO3B5 TaxID=2607811 RepID=UPI0013FFC206|nr:hypothetical protein [Okeania sp. SIO3B5]NEO57751.1 hypothetical protein [Okeania sp. SIO3B5]
MEDYPLHPSNNPNSLTLGQRLQRRVVEPAGVINTQQLHCHYQATQGMAGRLVQRLALPEQVKFRYGSGVLQPTAITQRLQRQRTESAEVLNEQFPTTPYADSAMGEMVQRSIPPQSRQFQNSREIQGRSPNKLGRTNTNPLQPSITQKATVMTKPVEKKPQSDTSVVKTSRGETNRPFRISRKATVSEVNASNLGARVEAEPNSKQDRDLPLPKATNQLSASTVQRKADTSVNPNSLVTATQPKTNPPLVKGIIQTKTNEGLSTGNFRISRKATVSEVNARNLRARVEAEPNSKQDRDLPLPKATNQLSASTVQRKADTSVNPNSLVTATQPKTNLPLVKGIIQTKAEDFNVTSIVPKTDLSQSRPLSLQGQKSNLPVQLSPEASIASNPSSELNMVWLKSTDGLQANEGSSTKNPYSEKIALPLAITPINTHGVLTRQTTNTVDNSTVQLAMEGNSTTPMPAPETASGASVDIAKVAEQVSRILARQLAVEKERRGV